MRYFIPESIPVVKFPVIWGRWCWKCAWIGDAVLVVALIHVLVGVWDWEDVVVVSATLPLEFILVALGTVVLVMYRMVSRNPNVGWVSLDRNGVGIMLSGTISLVIERGSKRRCCMEIAASIALDTIRDAIAA